MKYIKYTLLLCAAFLISCLQPDKELITSDNVLRSIKVFLPGSINPVMPEAAGPYNDENIEIVFEGDPKMDLSSVKVIATAPNNATIEPAFSGYTVDLSKPYSFKIIGYDGNVKNYTLTSRIIPSVFKIRELYYKTPADMGFTQYDNRAVAISGNHFVLHSNKNVFKYYDLETGASAGQLSMEGIEWDAVEAPGRKDCFYMTSDEGGRIFATNLSLGKGGNVKLYKWDNVTAQPQLFLNWVNTENADAGRKIYVKGDISTLAYIYYVLPQTKSFARWEVKEGALTNQDPDIVQVNFPEFWDVNAVVVPLETSKTTNYFSVVNREAGGFNFTAFFSGTNNTKLFKSDMPQWLGWGTGLDYLDYKGIKLLFHTELNRGNWMYYYAKVTQLVRNPESNINFLNLIGGRVWETWIEYDHGLGLNNNITSDVESRLNTEKDAGYVVYMATNMGLSVSKITLD